NQLRNFPVEATSVAVERRDQSEGIAIGREFDALALKALIVGCGPLNLDRAADYEVFAACRRNQAERRRQVDWAAAAARLRSGIVNYQSKILVGSIVVTRDAVSCDVGGDDANREIAGCSGGQPDGFDVVSAIGRPFRNRATAGEYISEICLTANVDLQIEVVDRRVCRRVSRSVGPGERYPKRL